MKRKWISTLVLTSLAALLLSGNTFAAENKGTISVSGKGVVSVKPDTAQINLGVTIDDTDAKAAQDKSTSIMNNVLETVKAFGIEDKDIQTSRFSIYPKYDYSPNGSQSVIGYTVTNSINVTVKNIDQTGEILDAAIKAGSNYGGNVTFLLSDDTPYYLEALDKAIKNAGVKAGAIAKSLNVTIGRPASISENSYVSPSFTENMKYSYDTGAGALTGASISQGELEVIAVINAVYEY